MIIAIPREITEEEKRVAATPETVKKFVAAGFAVSVEAGAGSASFIPDKDFEAAGAKVVGDVKTLFAQADVVLKVQKPSVHPVTRSDEIQLIKENACLISFLQPLLHRDLVQKISDRKITALAIDMVPRIARAQKLDALSSQANVAGYKAVLMAAGILEKMLPMMMTAAGTISPSKVLVLGAGVAGLEAIATAKRLGALVEAFDTRPAVKDQVQSLGAKFIELEVKQGEAEDKGGYAKELSKEDHDREIALISSHVKSADIVISTAQIPGKRAPLLVTEEAVKSMRPGSVVVDLAAEGGGNCALTETGKTVTKHGITIVGMRNFPSLMASQSSQLYARNVLGLFFEIIKDGKINLDMNNEVIKGALITHGGKIVHEATLKSMGQAALRS